MIDRASKEINSDQIVQIADGYTHLRVLSPRLELDRVDAGATECSIDTNPWTEYQWTDPDRENFVQQLANNRFAGGWCSKSTATFLTKRIDIPGGELVLLFCSKIGGRPDPHVSGAQSFRIAQKSIAKWFRKFSNTFLSDSRMIGRLKTPQNSQILHEGRGGGGGPPILLQTGVTQRLCSVFSWGKYKYLWGIIVRKHCSGTSDVEPQRDLPYSPPLCGLLPPRYPKELWRKDWTWDKTWVLSASQ